MKILFLTTKNQESQGDYLELTILLGLKAILGNNVIDIPKKKIIYGDFSKSAKNQLHGKGFTLLSEKIEDLDIKRDEKSILEIKFDAIIIGCGHLYGEQFNLNELNKITKNIWILDGHDLYGNAKRKIYHNKECVIGIQYNRSFKRELVENPFKFNQVYPTGFGIPESKICEINLLSKTQLFQQTAPDYALFRIQNDLGGSKHHKFTIEKKYYMDISNSWFGLTCKKGGWDCLRHYEILAAGSLLLFRDYKYKPKNCSPQNLPCISYSTIEELYEVIERLLPNGKPSLEYFEILSKQRQWLLNFGTVKARADFIIHNITQNKNENNPVLFYSNFFIDSYSSFIFYFNFFKNYKIF